MFNKGDELDRRNFIMNSARSFLGVSVLPLVANEAGAAVDAKQKPFVPARPKSAKSVIFLNMNGGMSHLDTFDPKEKKEVMGDTEVASTNADGVKLGHWLPKLSALDV